MSTGHCEAAVIERVSDVPGVEAVTVDLDSKVVRVSGAGFGVDAVLAAIDDAGYDAVLLRHRVWNPVSRR